MRVKQLSRSAKKVPKILVRRDALTRAEAQKLRDGIVEDFKAAEGRLVEAAIKLDKFVRGEGWVPLGYDTMTDWREKEMNFTQFYTLRHVLRLLEAGVSTDKIQRMSLTNIDTMVRQLPEARWKESAWQKAAADMPVTDFKAKAVAAAEEAGTVQEEIQRRGFPGPKSLVEKWDLALKVAETVDGARRIDERVDAIVSAYLNGQGGRPGKSRLQQYEELVSGKTE